MAKSALTKPRHAIPARQKVGSTFPPTWIKPQLAKLVEKAPDGSDWLHEIKFDGYRMHARLDGGRVQILTRRGNDWTDKYPVIANAIAGLLAQNTYLDGELCGVLPDGRTAFNLTQNATDTGGGSPGYRSPSWSGYGGVFGPWRSRKLRWPSRRHAAPGSGSPLVLSRVHWVRPEMVVEVSDAEWTPDGPLRHVVYLGEHEISWPSRFAAADLMAASIDPMNSAVSFRRPAGGRPARHDALVQGSTQSLRGLQPTTSQPD
jgi:ATP-dependent DNA ligase